MHQQKELATKGWLFDFLIWLCSKWLTSKNGPTNTDLELIQSPVPPFHWLTRFPRHSGPHQKTKSVECSNPPPAPSILLVHSENAVSPRRFADGKTRQLDSGVSPNSKGWRMRYGYLQISSYVQYNAVGLTVSNFKYLLAWDVPWKHHPCLCDFLLCHGLTVGQHLCALSKVSQQQNLASQTAKKHLHPWLSPNEIAIHAINLWNRSNLRRSTLLPSRLP